MKEGERTTYMYISLCPILLNHVQAKVALPCGRLWHQVSVYKLATVLPMLLTLVPQFEVNLQVRNRNQKLSSAVNARIIVAEIGIQSLLRILRTTFGR